MTESYRTDHFDLVYQFKMTDVIVNPFLRSVPSRKLIVAIANALCRFSHNFEVLSADGASDRLRHGEGGLMSGLMSPIWAGLRTHSDSHPSGLTRTHESTHS